jgi:hypothetical protein
MFSTKNLKRTRRSDIPYFRRSMTILSVIYFASLENNTGTFKELSVAL